MVEPNTKFTQAHAEHFVPDETLAVFFGTTKYDQAWEMTTDKDDNEIVKKVFDDMEPA